MDVQRIFQVLGIEETKEEGKIREAYRSKLVTVNPEDNPEGFKRLRKAYEDALVYIKQENEEVTSDNPVSLFIKRVDGIYRFLPRRLDAGQWEALLKEELLDDLEYGEEAKWRLFVYLADHYRLPARIWQILGRVFRIQQEEEEFKEHLPENFVDFMLWKLSEDGANGEFPYEKLTGEPEADYDSFIDDYNVLTELFGRNEEPEDREQWLREIGQKIAGMDSYGISHPWFILEKAKYALELGQQEEAQRIIRALWETGEKDDHLLLRGADILNACGKETEAEEVYRSFSEREENSADVYHALVEMAKICLKKGEIVEAREHAKRARDIYNTDFVQELLQECNTKLIIFYTQEKEELTVEDAIQLAWCYIQTRRSEEGYEYFQAHPILTEDTAKCHRVKAVMYMLNDRTKEALEETRRWRELQLQEEEKDIFLEAQSFDLEGRCLVADYHRLGKNDGKQAEALKQAVITAFEEAISRQPEEIDFLMSKMLFLRDVEEYESMAEVCERMMTVDKGFFWAYFYAQEAYEALGKDQEVVDTFYDAKAIYAGRPEIYERAARVFRKHDQLGETENIIRQAEEAGVDSPYLQVRRLELTRRDAEDEDEETIRKADLYASKVIEGLEECRAKDPESVSDALLAEAYMERVYIQEDTSIEQLDKLEEWLHKAVALRDELWNRYYIGRFYIVHRKDAKTAYEHLKKCEEREMDFEWLYYFIARCHEEFEQWDEATVYYQKAMEKAPDNNDFPWRVAWLYRNKFRRTGREKYGWAALAHMDIQIEKFGKDSSDAWQLSDIYARFMSYDKALEEIDIALENDKDPVHWGHKAKILERLGREEESFAVYEKAIEIGLEKETDYDNAYKQIYHYFLRHRKYEEGIQWLKAAMERLATEDGRSNNLDRIKLLYCKLGNREKALEAFVQSYGDITLKHHVCDSWEEEGERIEALLEAYRFLRAEEELSERAQEAAALLEARDAAKLTESHEGKRRAYMEIGNSYADMLDDEKALFYFQKALEHAGTSETDSAEYEDALDGIMRCLWHMGRMEEAKQFGEKYLQSLAEGYKECNEPERTLEELHAGENCLRRHSLYELFIISFFSSDYEKAERYLEQMGISKWCWNCAESECTEEWECRGYIALIKGNKEDAKSYFRHALSGALNDNSDARRELKRLERQQNTVDR